ncbi:hypothetical protein DRN73_06995 [Candidatus Pacearchaeota archaeon]|nr:MAG: hypothetical protein DRN73_06995 [Candidatus Pacearchaeota archaeon]
MRRIEKMISLAKSVPYTNDELRILLNLINDKLIDMNGLINETYLNIVSLIEDQIENRGTYIDRGSSDSNDYRFKKLNFLQYLLVYFKRIFIFLVYIPLENVPLYINDNQLNPFCHWRLLINK